MRHHENRLVYVLTNPGLPHAVKIGQTTRTADTRAGELRRAYGTAYPFAVASKHAVADPAAVEALAHLRLRRCRVPRSELFHCDAAPQAGEPVRRTAARL
jgi:hypothetical protein